MSGAADEKAVYDLPGLTPGSYARWRASTVGAITEHLERRLVLELIGEVQGRQVLDVGCGDGGLAIRLSKRRAQVVAIDSSSMMIGAAKQSAERNEADIEFRVATAQGLPFPPEQFDIVVAVTILCFVEDASPVLREMTRVLRPGGHLVIGELGKWSSWAAARKVRAWLGSHLWQKAKFRTSEELRSLARSAGLSVDIIQGAIYYPRLALAARLLASCDRWLSGITTFGAAFIALRATKPKTRD